MSTGISRAQRALATNNSSVVLNRTVGGDNRDRAYSLTETSNGGLAFAGYTEPVGGPSDAWVVKLNSSGDVVLNRTFGGGDRDRAWSLIETSDGSLAFAGKTRSFGTGLSDAWVVKLNSSGDVVLNRTFGGGDRESARSVIETSEGRLAFAGFTDSFGDGSGDAWVVKLNSSGDVVLNRTVGSSDSDAAKSLIETSDGGLAFAGDTEDGKLFYDAWVVKLNSSGAVVLNRQVGGSEGDEAESLVETSDGGLAFAGTTDSFGDGPSDAWVVKLNSSGNVALNRTFGGSDADAARSVIETSDGDLVFAGRTNSFGNGSGSAWVVKLNSSGDVVLNRTVGGSFSDRAVSLIETRNGRLAFAGYTSSFGNGAGDGWVVKLETQGNRCESLPQAIDSDGNDKIGDSEVVDAIDYWRDVSEVPGTCGKTIDDVELLNLIESWRNSETI